MTPRVVPAAASFAASMILAALLSTGSVPANAATAPPDDGPITVVIPPGASPSPSPSGTAGSGGSSGGGSGGGSGSGTGVDPGDGGSGGGAATCPSTNADGSPVPSNQITDDAPELAIDKDRLAAGEWVIASATDFTRGEKAQVVMYPGAVVIGSYTVDAPTGFAARFRVPEGTPTGLYSLEVTGWQSCYVENGEVTVVSPPATNSPALWWVYVVLGVLSIGLVSLAFAFRADIALWFGGPPAPGPSA